MTRLAEIFDQMNSAIRDLKIVMEAEQQQLSAGHINGSLLQRITEQKSSLLATLDYLEQQRRVAQDDDDSSGYLQAIRQQLHQLRDLNQHNGWLLEGQLARNQQALEVLKPHQEPSLYGANGLTSASLRGGKKVAI